MTQPADRRLITEAAGNATYVSLLSKENSSSIQARLDALATRGGGELRLGAGEFLVPVGLTIPANVTLTGEGMGVTVLKIPDYSPIMAALNIGDGTTPVSNVTIRDLTVDGNEANQAEGTFGSHLIRAEYAPNLALTRVEVCNGINVGFSHNGRGNFTEPIHLTDVWVHHCRGDGILMQYRTRHTYYTNVHCTNNGGVGFYCDQSEVHLNYVVCKENAGNGFEFNNIQRSGLDNIYATRNGGHGIFVQSVISSQGTNWIAQNNGVSGPGFSDVYFDNDSAQSYGITSDTQIVGIWAGARPEWRGGVLSTTEDYALYVMDGHTGRVELSAVHLSAANVAPYRLPAALGELRVDGPGISTWSEVDLLIGANTGGSYANAAWSRSGANTVMLRGRISGPIDGQETLFVLPEGARPKFPLNVVAATAFLGNQQLLTIRADGHVRLTLADTASVSWLSLDGITFSTV